MINPYDVCYNKHKGNENSNEANKNAAPRKIHTRMRIALALWQQYQLDQSGLSCESLENVLECTRSTVSARISDMKFDGHIFAYTKGETMSGSPCDLYMLTELGEDFYDVRGEE